MTDRDRLGADSLREIRERAERIGRRESKVRHEACRDTANLLVRDVLALVAEREALLAENERLTSKLSAEIHEYDAALNDLGRENASLRGRVAVLEAALRDADDLLRRLSEWDVLNLAPGSGDDGPYWQREIAKARAVLAGGDAVTYSNPEVGPPFVEHSTYTTGDVGGGDEVATSGGDS